MNPTKNSVRVAGLLYLLLAIAGIIGDLYIPSRLIVSGDAAATADSIVASEALFRLAIGIQLLAAIVFIFLVRALYGIFKDVDRSRASLMVVLVLAVVPVLLLNAVNELAALVLLSGADFLSVFGQPQLEALAYLFLRLHGQVALVAAIFFGLWLFPLGTLALRSGFVPRVVGYLVILAGIAYVVNSSTSLLVPQYRELVSTIATPAVAGEVAMIVWLLVRGLRVERREELAHA